MRAIPITAAVVGALGLAACDGGGGCETLVVEDTIQVYESDGQIVAMAKNDTQPKPYARCLKLTAAREAGVRRDTQPKP